MSNALLEKLNASAAGIATPAPKQEPAGDTPEQEQPSREEIERLIANPPPGVDAKTLAAHYGIELGENGAPLPEAPSAPEPEPEQPAAGPPKPPKKKRKARSDKGTKRAAKPPEPAEEQAPVAGEIASAPRERSPQETAAVVQLVRSCIERGLEPKDAQAFLEVAGLG